MGDLLPSPGAFGGTEVASMVLLTEERFSGCWSPFFGDFRSSGVLVALGGTGCGLANRVESVLRAPLLSVPNRAEEARLGGAVAGCKDKGLGAGGISKFFAGPRLTRTQSRMPLSEPYPGSPTGSLAWGDSPIQTAPKLASKLKECRLEADSLHNGSSKRRPGYGGTVVYVTTAHLEPPHSDQDAFPTRQECPSSDHHPFPALEAASGGGGALNLEAPTNGGAGESDGKESFHLRT